MMTSHTLARARLLVVGEERRGESPPVASRPPNQVRQLLQVLNDQSTLSQNIYYPTLKSFDSWLSEFYQIEAHHLLF